MELKNIRMTELRHDEALRRYLKLHNVTMTLRSAIWKFLQRHNSRSLVQSSVEHIAHLPIRMTVALRAEVMAPLIHFHPFFNTLFMGNQDKRWGFATQEIA